MKGRNTFSTFEVQQIKELIEQKVKALSNQQKTIRQEIRNIGFYYSDFSPAKDGYTVSDFENLLSSGQITVSYDTE